MAERKTLAWRVGSSVLGVGWLAAVFGAAGTLRWAEGWAYLAVLVAGLGLQRGWVARRNPELIQRRKEIPAAAKGWDRRWVVVFWPLMLSVPIVAALDVVRGGGEPMPAGAWLVGAVMVGGGIAVGGWAMGVNVSFEGLVVVRPGQRVVDTGPYRFVRHPGYVGIILWALGTPALLRSWWSVAPAVAAAAWVVVRTALEDATLKRELPGYDRFAARVQFRLLPGVW